jgi:succinate dehydrogenase / fumarate reductase, flavoprotein subunit
VADAAVAALRPIREEYERLLRDDARFAHVAAWEFTRVGEKPVRHREPLVFESVHLSQRSYT